MYVPPQPQGSPSFYPYPDPDIWQPVRRRERSTVDIVLTAVLGCAYVFVAFVSVWLSLFFAMATDVCSSGSPCDTSGVTRAYLVTDGGAVVLFLCSTVALVVMAVRRLPMFWIPLCAGLIQIGLVIIGAHLAVVPTP